MCRVVPAWPQGGMLFGSPLSLRAQLPVLDLFVCAGPSLLGLSCPCPVPRRAWSPAWTQGQLDGAARG